MVWWPVPHVPVLPPTEFSSLYAVGVLRSGSGRSAAGGVIHLPTVVRGRIQTDSSAVCKVSFVHNFTYSIPACEVAQTPGIACVAWSPMVMCAFCRHLDAADFVMTFRAADGCDSWPLARNPAALNRGVTRSRKRNGPCTSAYWPRGAPQKRKRANGETRVRVPGCPMPIGPEPPIRSLYSLNYH